MYPYRLWKLFLGLAASVLVLAVASSLIAIASDLITHANTGKLPDAIVERYNYDGKQNALSGRVKNNTNLLIKSVAFGFTATSGGIKRSEMVVNVPQLRPQEQRAFRENCPADWKNIGINTNTVELSTTAIPLN